MTHATQAVKVTPLPAKPGGAILCAASPNPALHHVQTGLYASIRERR